MPTEMRFTKAINAPAEAVFKLLIHLADYDKWLSASALYGSLAQISDNPVKLGSTYLDKGTSSVMKGSVTEFEAPRLLTFLQQTATKVLIFNVNVNIRIRYTLESIATGTQLIRDTAIDIRGIPGFAQSLLLNQIRRENERILHKIKTYLETPH